MTTATCGEKRKNLHMVAGCVKCGEEAGEKVMEGKAVVGDQVPVT